MHIAYLLIVCFNFWFLFLLLQLLLLQFSLNFCSTLHVSRLGLGPPKEYIWNCWSNAEP